jgi:ribosomal protein L37AE/L43A
MGRRAPLFMSTDVIIVRVLVTSLVLLIFYLIIGKLRPQTAPRSQMMCPACGLITPRSIRTCFGMWQSAGLNARNSLFLLLVSEGPMSKRQGADCGGELVLAVTSVQPQGSNHEPALRAASTHWTCTTCGSVFTATRLRHHKRDALKFHEST